MTTVSAARAVALPQVVERHVDEAALLCNQRLYLVRAPHPKLHQLRRLDDRLAAHLDGLLVAREMGSRLADLALANAGRGELFTAVSLAFDNHDAHRLQRLFAAAEALPEAQEACVLAVGWVSAQSLRGISRDMLASPSAFQRRVALAACGFHMVDPGQALIDALQDDDAALRVQALRTAGDCARVDLAQACLEASADADAGCGLWAARSALMLGERGRAPLERLHQLAGQPGPLRTLALSVLLKCIASAEAAPLLRKLLDEPKSVREAMRGMGMVGDPQVIPWLIAQMDDPALSRLAGEAFSTITGLDLAWLDLDKKPPEGLEPGPTDDPQDHEVAMDEDGGLPWPDRQKVQGWWNAQGPGFQRGARYFMGAPPSPAHCRRVLKEGFQRQRIAAAEHLCLAEPGNRLFPTAAPAWRQQRWLDAMPA
ncbi:TIGR02270 family protein [Variovorax sp. LARHSF232]